MSIGAVTMPATSPLGERDGPLDRDARDLPGDVAAESLDPDASQFVDRVVGDPRGPDHDEFARRAHALVEDGGIHDLRPDATRVAERDGEAGQAHELRSSRSTR